jgi:regulator of sigma E protease
VWKRIVVISAGPAVNLVIAFLLLFGLAFGAGELTKRVGDVQPGSPAQTVLRPGDRIISVDGRTGDQLDFQRQISRHRCAGEPRKGCRARTPVVLRVERGGRVVTLRVRPRYDPELERTRIGFTYATKSLDSPTEAAGAAVELMWAVTTGTVDAIVRIFDPEKREQISGVVGSYEITRQAFTFDERRALSLLAVISLSLAIINLFPFLPLDGGHVFWSLVEKVRGRAVPFRVMEQAGVVGFMLVIFLFFIGLSNDIGRLTGGGFETR